MAVAQHARDLPLLAVLLPHDDEIGCTLAGVGLELAEAMHALGDGAETLDWIDAQAPGDQLASEVAADEFLRVADHVGPAPGDAAIVVIELDAFREIARVLLQLARLRAAVESREDLRIERCHLVEELPGRRRFFELLDACDSYFPEPVRDIDKPVLMPIEDVFSISGRGTVVTGRVERGIIKVGDEVEIVGIKDTVKTTCTGVEMFRKILDQGQAGDNVGVLLRGIKREDVERGQVLAKPGSIKPHRKFKAEVYVLSKEEGGRHTPFFSGYRPQFYFRTTDVTGVVTLAEGVEMVMPGDNATFMVELIAPIAMETGLRFAIREGGRTVGAGVVTEIME